jgi:hypothetical protein
MRMKLNDWKLIALLLVAAGIVAVGFWSLARQ